MTDMREKARELARELSECGPYDLKVPRIKSALSAARNAALEEARLVLGRHLETEAENERLLETINIPAFEFLDDALFIYRKL